MAYYSWIKNNVQVKCDECGNIIEVEKNDFNFEGIFGYSSVMGGETNYEAEGFTECLKCQNNIEIKLKVSEYPSMVYNDSSEELVGATLFDEVEYVNDIFVKYDDEDYYDNEYEEYFVSLLDVKIEALLYRINTSFNEIKTLIKENNPIILKLAYGAIFANIEGFLKDLVLYLLSNYKEALDNFINNHEEFMREKISLKKAYTFNFEKRAKAFVSRIIFHRFNDVEKIFNYILNTKDNKLIEIHSKLGKYVQKRHAITHNFHKDQNDSSLEVTTEELEKLLKSCEEVCENVNEASKKFIENIQIDKT